MFRFSKPNTQQKNRASNYPYEAQKRSLVNIAALQGAHRRLLPKFKHFSPLQGAMAIQTGMLEQLYATAQLEEQPTAISQMTKLLFYKKDNHALAAIRNKSLPAYSLTPKILALIMYHMHQDTLGLSSIKTMIHSEWNAQHFLATNTKITFKKVNEFLDSAIALRKESLNKKHTAFLSEEILSGFLCLKFSAKQDIDEFLQELNSLEPILATIPEIDVRVGKEVLEKLESSKSPAIYLQDHYEEVVLSLLSDDHKLQRVMKANYGYKGRMAQPNCVEASFHNLCNIFLFNRISGCFDFSLLPAGLQPNAKLKAFYAMQNFKTDSVNLMPVGQAFMDLLAGRSDLFIYSSDDYELKSTSKNFTGVMNYLFGSTAKSLDDFAPQFSDDRRQINFVIDEDDDEILHITIKEKGLKKESIKFDLVAFRAYLHASCLDDKRNTAKNSFKKISELVSENRTSNPLLFSLVTQMHDEYVKNIVPSMMTLNLMSIYCPPKNWTEAYAFIKTILPHLQDHFEFKNYVLSLLRKFDQIFSVAVANKQTDLALLCIEAKIQLNKPNSYPLLSFIIEHDFTEKVLPAMLNAGANPNVGDIADETPLHCAARKKNVAAVVALLHAGADVNARNKKGLLPIHLSENDAITQLLQDAAMKKIVTNMFGLFKPFLHSVNKVHAWAFAKNGPAFK